MKKICVVTYVFGDKYQSFIPIFIYSVLKAYPDYYVKIYTDRALSSQLQEELASICKMGSFEIISDCLTHVGLTQKALRYDQISKCVRWLYIDEDYEKYDAIYIGDIDIFMVQEKIPLFDQHMIHAGIMQSCYSNFIREQQIAKSFKNFIRFLLKYGLKETFKFFKTDGKIKKLSGLHFIITKDYLPLLEKYQKHYIEELNLLAESKSSKWNLCSFNNEHLLYCLIRDMQLFIPPNSHLSARQVLEQTNPNEMAFRPFHGLHLGLWRKDKYGSLNGDTTIMDHDIYKEAYHYFKMLNDTDTILQEMLLNNNFASEVIHNMIYYYEKEM